MVRFCTSGMPQPQLPKPYSQPTPGTSDSSYVCIEMIGVWLLRGSKKPKCLKKCLKSKKNIYKGNC